MGGHLIDNLLDLQVVGASAHPLTFLLVLQAADVALTLVHSLQELKGRLWDYFGAIVGVRIPKWVGLFGPERPRKDLLWRMPRIEPSLGLGRSSLVDVATCGYNSFCDVYRHP